MQSLAPHAADSNPISLGHLSGAKGPPSTYSFKEKVVFLKWSSRLLMKRANGLFPYDTKLILPAFSKTNLCLCPVQK